MSTSSGPNRSIGTALPFGLLAAFAGMASCTGVFSRTKNHVAMSHPVLLNVLIFFSPFLFGGVVTALVYWGLDRFHAKHFASAPQPQIDPGVQESIDGGGARRLEAPGGSGAGAIAVFLSILGISAVIGAIMFGMFLYYGGDGGLPSSRAEALAGLLSGAWQGIVIGGFFGLLVATPAAIIVAFMGRRNR